MVGSFATMLAVRLGLGIRRGALRADFLWQRPVVVALYRARYRHCRDLGRVQPRAGARRTGRGLVDRDAVVALVLHHHRRGRICLGAGMDRVGLDAGKNAMATAGGARTHPCRARRRHRTAEPRRCWLSWAHPLSSDLGSVHLPGLPRLHRLPLYFLAAELPPNRSAPVDAQFSLPRSIFVSCGCIPSPFRIMITYRVESPVARRISARGHFVTSGGKPSL